MNCNKWPYWVRGGVIGLLIWAALITFAHSLAQKINVDIESCVDNCPATQSQIFFAWFHKIYQFPYGSLIHRYPYSTSEALLVPLIVFVFLFGILGWLYGKIKGRRKLQALSPKP